MAAITPARRGRMLMRSFAIQGSWNYSTMLGAGMAYALIPALSAVYRDDAAALARAVGRHAGFFNAHPYLAGVAIGSLARLEAEGVGEEELRRFRNALVSPLGTLGDRLVWARWRPFCSVVAVLLAATGAPWWLAGGTFLVLYNVVHLGLRAWGFRLGWREGRSVAAALRDSPLRRLPDRLTIPVAAISGIVLPPVALAVGSRSGAGPLSIVVISFTLAAVGFWRPTFAGRAAALILALGALALGAFDAIL